MIDTNQALSADSDGGPSSEPADFAPLMGNRSLPCRRLSL